MTRRLPLLAALAPVVLVTGCFGVGGDDVPDAHPAADALATGLASGDLSAVAFASGVTADQATQSYDDLVSGLGEVTPEVKVADVETSSDHRATATLDWSWPLGAGWSYSRTVALSRANAGWRVSWTPSLVAPALKDGVVLDASTVSAKRGDLLGAGGVGLITERPVVTFGVDRTKVSGRQLHSSARQLARVLGIDVSSYLKLVKASGPQAFVQGIVYRKEQVPSGLIERATAIKGVDALAGDQPLGITKEFAAPILGTVGPVTAEMVQQDPEVYRAGDVAGLSGLEARYDEQLRGKPGVEVAAVDGDGNTVKTLFSSDATDGEPLKLTLDDRYQALAEQVLAQTKPASAIVAIRPSDGAILAAANGPGNDGQNFATYGRYAPGSTFKTVGSLALLKEGATPNTKINCPPSLLVDGKRFSNDKYYPSFALGRIRLATALAWSCNTAYINGRTRLAPDDLVNAAATLGMGIDHDVGFPAYFGQVERPTSETTKAADMIGQGQILASPMTMATVMASVVAGHTVVPQLVTSVDEAPPASAAKLTGKQDRDLRTMLRGVVVNGTGGSRLRDVPGKPVIAKTGTAEFDRGKKRLTHTWMIAGQGNLAVCVFVDVGETGAGTAGPLMESFLRGVHAL